jgi:hypothetical protein
LPLRQWWQAERIPYEQKLKMNFEFEQYRKRVEEELEKGR